MRIYLWAVQITFILISAVANATHGNVLLGVLPVALAVAISILERVPGGNTGMHTALFWGAGAVTLASFVASYVAMVSYLTADTLPAKEQTPMAVALLVPFGIDGIILVSSMALLIMAGNSQRSAQEPRTATNGATPVGPGGMPVPRPGTAFLPLLPVLPVPMSTQEHDESAPGNTGNAPGAGEEQDAYAGSGGFPPDGDAGTLWERYGSTLPPVRNIQKDMGWGSTRATNAAKVLRASLNQAAAKF